jgi:hypothetical protein
MNRRKSWKTEWKCGTENFHTWLKMLCTVSKNEITSPCIILKMKVRKGHIKLEYGVPCELNF